MSQVEIIENEFCLQVAANQKLWTIQDEKGIPAPENSEKIRSMPFWSSHELAQAYISNASGYQAFQPLEIDWAVFAEKWAQGIHHDGLCVGLNWLAEQETNVDIEVAELVEKIKAAIKAKDAS
ncbi:DUF2750 domain-containing protein [Saccharobesus litoralis]|uniref:DUF2750 domain-containing protein n=1 Tax=Saccharobesus litoralis TaxID=2172099 RepID=A0A2S0VT90_9ALTE|nr:DUF2750 domain-containing protein [Saccharobesus litoralis]AWB67436.1 DUF2750 domain-containing protein [Saccharobesus litoralis]